MLFSYKELFYISKDLLSTVDLRSLLNKLNDLFNKHLNIKTWAIVIKPLNTLYFFYNDTLFFLDNYNRDVFDWIEFDEIFYDFNQNKDNKVLDLINNISIKLEKKFIDIDDFKVINLMYKELFSIEVYNDNNLDIEQDKEFFDIVNSSLLNVIKYKSLIELNKQDSLTGLYNYKEFYKMLNDEIEVSKKENKNFSIVFIDIDEFKQVNDKYGHLTGSNILIEFGNILLQDIRHKDCITRYGGDEYLILLRETGKKEAVSVSKRLLNLIRENKFISINHELISITASMGIATYPTDADDIKKLISVADTNMYIVKKDSKNGVKW
jgi:diguanylate cyclase (GGDEF)-like protein